MICAPRRNLDLVIPIKFRNNQSRFATRLIIDKSVTKGNGADLPTNQIPQRILLLDDNPIFLRAIGRLMETHSYRVRTEHCHRSALQTLSRQGNHFDLALVDVGLGGCSGWEFAEKLNQCENAPPVMLMSGECRDRDVQATSNVKGFIAKPFSMADLFRSIANMNFNAAVACS